MSNKELMNPGLNDMPVDELRKYGHEFIDWIVDYIENIEAYPVLSKSEPGEIKNSLPNLPPQDGEDIDSILSDMDRKIMPGITHWNHPNFMAYFNSTSSGPGVLAELLSAGFNANGMAWHTCPSATELEETMAEWYKKMLNLPEDFWGIIYDTASTSTMHAIAAAREQLSHLKIREKGMFGRKELQRLSIYSSEQAHFSIDKAAITLGFGLEAVRKIPVDSNYSMIPLALKETIEKDKKDGWLPCCVVATVGTTSTTSVDDVDAIGTICRREKIWLHVDAAYAGTAAILPPMRWIFNGIENADSLVINPHKWMFTPFDYSFFFTRKPEVLKRAFSVSAEYFDTSKDEVTNYMDYGMQQGRRFRSLKLWFIIRYFGVEGIRKRIAEHLRLANEFADWIDSHPDFERMAPTPFSVVCFRAHPKNIDDRDKLNALNEKLLDEINKTGKLFLSSTKLNGKFVIRIAISSIRTMEKNVLDAQQLIEQKLNKLLEE
ncbi:MAG: pyridoxal-dependent decarboxylase [Ignavibacteriaceae bacterium]